MKVIVTLEAVTIELTRTNLRALLAKLDGHPPDSACTIGKNGFWIKAVEDQEHYAIRLPGAMHPDTDQAISQ